jgi:integrase
MTKLMKFQADVQGIVGSLIDTQLIFPSFERIFNNLDVSVATKADYQSRAFEFYMYLEHTGVHLDSLLRYKQLLKADRTTKSTTKNKKLSVARLFAKEMFRSGLLPRDISVGVKGFTQSSLHKTNGLDDADIKKIRNWIHADRVVTKEHYRIYSILMLLSYHGLRQTEICRLEYADIDFVNGFAFVQGKGRDDKQKVHLHRAVIDMLHEYCQAYNVQSGSLFFSLSNNGSYGKPLTTRGLRNIVTTVLERLEIFKNVHSFRHFYTTTLVKAYRGDLFRVMHFTRHKSLSMLQVYNDEIEHESQYPVHDKIFTGVL